MLVYFLVVLVYCDPLKFSLAKVAVVVLGKLAVWALLIRSIFLYTVTSPLLAFLTYRKCQLSNTSYCDSF